MEESIDQIRKILLSLGSREDPGLGPLKDQDTSIRTADSIIEVLESTLGNPSRVHTFLVICAIRHIMKAVKRVNKTTSVEEYQGLLRNLVETLWRASANYTPKPNN